MSYVNDPNKSNEDTFRRQGTPKDRRQRPWEDAICQNPQIPPKKTRLCTYPTAGHTGTQQGMETFGYISNTLRLAPFSQAYTGLMVLSHVTSPFPLPMLRLKTAPSEKQGQEEGTQSKRNISLNPSGYMRKLEDSTVTRRRSLECSQRGL